ncbi:uncharacterized protein F5891DRAFT_947212 [Suillus fuscotomentosus]|uniref:BTB domain-containing protein n=1 Tax=Suillus fuscotomentosus TaxID=1912939 RepID=A0AAD4HBQ7_9AGAM|nr:uncharacterized protein F5891DRAFT_965805 [Suillus fuscotomentosus]XP_041229250.1 uncharacterized protein F5891DRAFT_947212 [Suillus fuscotomentosus]KAG1888977.1 hypothetical protein F5891DRAFT_965805 [Suillus fuscotomentosus]KAG1903675.1 hypothetical protein F5891DRAFT_947212 [Suillus fuscotomentosus]
MSPLSASASQLSFSSPVSRSSRSPSGNIRLPGLLGQSSVVASPVESVRSIASFFTKLRSPPRHSEFYLQDELSVFLVDGVLFRVHRFFLQRESDVFRTMFVCPPTQDGPEGLTDDKPIVLPEVTVAEFEALLKFLYDGGISPSPFSTADEWIRLLSIATRYAMERIRARALHELECLPPLDPIQKIALARKHDVREWLLPSYVALCLRREPLNVLEAVELGLETMVLIAIGRETVRDPGTLRDFEDLRQPLGYEEFMTAIVANIFGDGEFSGA